MFKQSLGEILGFMFLVLYLFQPPITELYNIRSNAVEIVLNQGIAKASSLDNGRFTPEIIQEMKETLKTKFFIPESNIDFVGTTTLTPRGEYIEGTLRVRSTTLWIIGSLTGSSNMDITKYATMMSEYVDR